MSAIWHMRMHQLSRATALSGSATTRLVNRLEATLAAAERTPELAPLIAAVDGLCAPGG